MDFYDALIFSSYKLFINNGAVTFDGTRVLTAADTIDLLISSQ